LNNHLKRLYFSIEYSASNDHSKVAINTFKPQRGKPENSEEWVL
jgi:hypothetical protein